MQFSKMAEPLRQAQRNFHANNVVPSVSVGKGNRNGSSTCHTATKLLTWQMNILIPITSLCKWNAFIFPYLQAHVFLFLISWKEKPFFLSCYFVPSTGSGAQLQTP